MTSGEAAPVALVSGGSSGIGLAIAELLAARGFHVAIAARDPARLLVAATSLRAMGGAGATCLPLDVTDAAACEAAVEALVQDRGRIDWLVTSAGSVEPGLFADLPLDAHRRQMEVNFFGTLNLVHPVSRHMAARGGGRMTLISSAAAFTGIVGYSGYCPGKAAIKALAEALSLELAPSGIALAVAFPPDTDTPQYASEQRAKPEVTKRITAGGGLMSAETVARQIIEGVDAGRFMITPGMLMTLFGWFHSLHAPFFMRQQRKAMAELMGKPSSPRSEPDGPAVQ